MPTPVKTQPTMRIDQETGLDWDWAQELKEGVCDALLERTKKVVSGDGDFGRCILGQKPSQALSSGFLVPRFENDDDVSSDIAISVHGIDCKLNMLASGVFRFVPEFNVYVRALPTAEEIFDARLRLRPKPELNADAERRKKEALAALKQNREHREKSVPEKRQDRKLVLAQVMKSLSIKIVSGDFRESDGEEGDQEAEGGIEILNPDTRIPDEHAKSHPIPEKYIRLKPTLPVLELSLPWNKTDWAAALETYMVLLNQSFRQAYIDWLGSEEGRDWAWRKKQIPGSSFWSKDHWNARLAELRRDPPDPKVLIPQVRLGVVVDVRIDPLTADTLTARFAIENIDGSEVGEDGIFQVKLGIDLPMDALRRMPMERIRRSYHFAGFLLIPAIGVNCGVEQSEKEGRCHLHTTWCPKFVLPRMRPTSRTQVPVDFEALKRHDFNVSDLSNLPDAMEAWVEKIKTELNLFESGEEGSIADENRQKLKFAQDIRAWKNEAKRIRLGISVLARSQKTYQIDPNALAAAPYRAWILTNETFVRATGNPGWRLFQLGFILTHVPTLASRLEAFSDVFDASFDEESASLLYMSTGGGKSEAFFGTLIFALFLDRLRGKKRGVTAMLHYPLRLLTLQQARRLMKLMGEAELLRMREKLGGAPFELGFWVGGANTPNSIASGTKVNEEARDIPFAETDPRLRRETQFREESPNYTAKNESWNKLPQCTFCDSRTGLRVFRQRKFRLGIVCESDDCAWNKAHDSKDYREPLPFLLVDVDIYRAAPSVLLGTIDKLALIGQHPSTINRIVGMFGMARFIEGDDCDGLLLTPLKRNDLADAQTTGRPLAPAFHGGHELFFDPLPSLVIQDEMHLLEESLGTFGGLFETALFAMFSELAKLLGDRAAHVPGDRSSPRMPHVIGATATAADADRQMQHLYQRRAVQFPHPGPKLYASFYTELEQFDEASSAHSSRGNSITARDQERSAPWARVYASLLTNGKTHTTATLSILSAYAVGITRWSRDFTSADPAKRDQAFNDVIDCLSDNRLSGRHADAIKRAQSASLHEVLAKLVDLHRIMLTYVTNKKGGDQLMSALDRQIGRQHELEGSEYELSSFDIELISGGVDIRGIQEVIRKAEARRNPMTDDIADSLRSIVATSAISHGVDVSAFNAMTFAGIPSDVAEYIQASSRVGRTHVGFSLLIPTPQNRRDRFVLDNHENYHRFLERMIAPPAIERWADKAIKRTLPSMIQMYLIGVLFQQEFCSKADHLKDTAIAITEAISLAERLVGNRAAASKKLLLEFLAKALGINARFAGSPNQDHYSNLLKQVVDDITTELQTGRHGGDLAKFWEHPEGPLRGSKPMSSLRDVDEGGVIRVGGNQKTIKGFNIHPGDTRLAMDFITKRLIAGRRPSFGAGELASEE